MSLGIYIQVPFCQTKCTYCNFHTGVFSSRLYEPYVAAVCREIRDHRKLLPAASISQFDAPDAALGPVDTVYIGGGTPSLLDPAALERLLMAIRAAFPCAPEEVTLEADPETVTSEKAAAWLEAGINRISLGVQSFHDPELKAAGRMHRRDDIYLAVELLRGAGFANLSFDLIAGLPHQMKSGWRESLDRLIQLSPEHVSVYLMEIDEGSRLGREVLAGGNRYSVGALPSDEQMAECYELACEKLADTGYEHYEISNWALPGFRSAHNLKYWRRDPYLGFGAGAHSFNGSQRWANAHDPAAYVATLEQGRVPVEQLETVTPGHALEEELFLGLRLLEGIDGAALESKYNRPLSPRLEDLCEKGMLEQKGKRVRLAPGRLAVSNEAFVALLS